MRVLDHVWCDSFRMIGTSKQKKQIRTNAWVTKDTLKTKTHTIFFYQIFHIFLIKILTTMDISKVIKVSLVKNAKAVVMSRLTVFWGKNYIYINNLYYFFKLSLSIQKCHPIAVHTSVTLETQHSHTSKNCVRIKTRAQGKVYNMK